MAPSLLMESHAVCCVLVLITSLTVHETAIQAIAEERHACFRTKRLRLMRIHPSSNTACRNNMNREFFGGRAEFPLRSAVAN